jgi:outer membrane protein OmpA-like peptidoglycan-associated protein
MRRYHPFTKVIALSAACLVGVSLSSWAEEKFTDFRHRSYSVVEVENALIPDAPMAPAVVRTRGIEPQQPQRPPVAAVTPAKAAVALNVFFEPKSGNILAKNYADLDKIGEVMVKHPQYRFQIEGHTDSVGSDAYNQALSEKRAESVKLYLVQRFPITPERLIARGFGESNPRMPNNTLEGRSINRRVEVVNLGLQ